VNYSDIPDKGFTLHIARVRGRASNTSYPERVKITSIDDLRNAAQFDHVCAEYADGVDKHPIIS